MAARSPPRPGISIEVIGPPLLRQPIGDLDPFRLQSWPLGCALAWMEGVRQGFPLNEIEAFVRRAYWDDAGAFACPTFESQALLIDAGRAGLLRATCDHKAIGPGDWSSLEIYQTLKNSRWRFAYVPKPSVDLLDLRLDMWFRAREVRLLWPGPRLDQAAPDDRAGAGRGKRGAKRKYDWDSCKARFLAQLDDLGIWGADNESGWQSQADAERWVLDWFEDAAPSPSSVRAYVKKWEKGWLAAKASN